MNTRLILRHFGLFFQPAFSFAGAGISMDLIKKLRDDTGSPIAQCKAALEQCKGDLDQAKEYLKQKGLASAQKKTDKGNPRGTHRDKDKS